MDEDMTKAFFTSKRMNKGILTKGGVQDFLDGWVHRLRGGSRV